MSLYTGKIAQLNESDKDRFFAVPNVDEVADRLERLGAIVQSITQLEGRNWRLL